MQDDISQSGGSSVAAGVYVVRHGEGDGARYAICTCVDVQAGDYVLPGTNETLAALVERQKLSAAHIEGPGTLTTFGWEEVEFDPQSGFRARLIYKE
jgi:hypothetical protein